MKMKMKVKQNQSKSAENAAERGNQPSSSEAAKTKPATTTVKKRRQKKKKAGGMFGGLQGGFLSGNNKKKNRKKKQQSQSQSQSQQNEKNIPFIKADKQAQRDELKLPEVQEEMKKAEEQRKAATPEWVTQDLLGKISSDPELLKMTLDPKYMKAMQEFASKPAAAAAKYAHDADMSAFFTKMAGVLTPHFTELGKKEEAEKKKKQKQKQQQNEKRQKEKEKDSGMLIEDVTDSDNVKTVFKKQPSPQPQPQQQRQVDPAQMQRWLNDPELRVVLNNPETSQILAVLQNDRNAFVRYQNHKGIRMLVRAGILQVPPEHAKLFPVVHDPHSLLQ
eukprot:TRINITY_DN66406_c8_g2_i1.p1 TRINITY_DN66406_c8_g2~~TRINITY_DN66406_c8_g2_i1.p1  ORF type:complete len:351 (+),score=197.69 TRINITY_DN66406_c8_g2_i1:57-1055(+)